MPRNPRRRGGHNPILGGLGSAELPSGCEELLIEEGPPIPIVRPTPTSLRRMYPNAAGGATPGRQGEIAFHRLQLVRVVSAVDGVAGLLRAMLPDIDIKGLIFLPGHPRLGGPHIVGRGQMATMLGRNPDLRDKRCPTTPAAFMPDNATYQSRLSATILELATRPVVTGLSRDHRACRGRALCATVATVDANRELLDTLGLEQRDACIGLGDYTPPRSSFRNGLTVDLASTASSLGFDALRTLAADLRSEFVGGSLVLEPVSCPVKGHGAPAS